MTENHGLISDAATVYQHRENCDILIEWLAENIRSGKDLKTEAHWTPQSYRCNILELYDLKILLVDQLSEQLTILLRDVVENVSELTGSTEANKSKHELRVHDILTPGLCHRINQVYENDQKIFQAARRKWQNLDMSVSTGQDIPRYDRDRLLQ